MLNGLRNDGIPGRVIVAGWVTQRLGPHAASIPVRRNNGQISFWASWPIGLIWRGQPVQHLQYLQLHQPGGSFTVPFCEQIILSMRIHDPASPATHWMEIPFSWWSSECNGPQPLWGKCETCVPALGNDTINSEWERFEKHFALPEKKSLSLVKKNGLENLLYRETIFYYQTELAARLVYYTNIKIKCPITVSGNNVRDERKQQKAPPASACNLNTILPTRCRFHHSVSKLRVYSRNTLPAEGSFKKPPLLSLLSIIYVPIFPGEL